MTLEDCLREAKRKCGSLANLYDEDVVIHKKDGYHYGRLAGYDGKNFYLDSYHFNNRLMDVFEYSTNSDFFRTAVIPARDIVSVAEIPMVKENKPEDIYSLS